MNSRVVPHSESSTQLQKMTQNQFFSDLPSLTDCIYTSHYCEENIWHLCKKITNLKLKGECFAVFISNPKKKIVLWKQKLGISADYVIWDYHVIAVYGNRENGYRVLDFDSTLPFAVTFEKYANEAIRSDKTLAREFHRFFRVIPAVEFLQHFSSDRRHMKVGDSWLQPPPVYSSLILDPKHPHNLEEFTSMNKSVGRGQVLTCDEFIDKFRKS